MEFVPALALALLVKKFIDFLRYASAKDWNGVTTQLVTWVSGVGAMFLVAQTDWAMSIMVGDLSVAALNGYSLVFVGLTVASGASAAVDALKAVNTSDTSVMPKLLNR